jgi:hypothetical protein
VDTGSREQNAQKQETRAPIRFHRIGKGSRALICPDLADIETPFPCKANPREFPSGTEWFPDPKGETGCDFPGGD